tara:strand:- start:76 stop:1062 length:987 start_codon:yes stop_codon:yes gene_type:complete
MSIRSQGNPKLDNPYNYRSGSTGLLKPEYIITLGWYGTRGVFAGGRDNVGPQVNTIDYVTISSTGNATDFGDLAQIGEGQAAASNVTRGVFAGRWKSPSPSAAHNNIDYITFATTGNASDFGDILSANSSMGGLAGNDRGVFAGGGNPTQNVIQYLTISTTGNTTDFGDLNNSTYSAAGVTNNTRGCFGGGSPKIDVIDYITIATTGNATDFGNLTVARQTFTGGCSDETRGIWGGGYHSGPNTYGDWIDYITIANTGNATDFGDLTQGRSGATATNNATRGVFAGGYVSGGPDVNTMDYITIQSTGNATDFGDLSQARGWFAASSGE